MAYNAREMVRPLDQQTTLAGDSITAVRRTRLFEGVVAQMRALIRDGRLSPGQKLPSERELAERFQVSRASLREAIRALEMEGLVVIRPGAGTFVSEEGFDAAMDVLANRLLAEREELADVMELRLVLEPQITALAAQRATPADFDRLEAILQDQAEQIQRGETGVVADTAFHSAVAAASHNRALERLSITLVEILAPVRDESLQTTERSYWSMESHRIVLEAIRAGDADVARQAMIDHIQGLIREISSTDE